MHGAPAAALEENCTYFLDTPLTFFFRQNGYFASSILLTTYFFRASSITDILAFLVAKLFQLFVFCFSSLMLALVSSLLLHTNIVIIVGFYFQVISGHCPFHDYQSLLCLGYGCYVVCKSQQTTYFLWILTPEAFSLMSLIFFSIYALKIMGNSVHSHLISFILFASYL